MTEDLLFLKENNEIQEDSDTDEALSLCDLPLGGEQDSTNTYDYSSKGHRTSSSDQELFEFFIDLKTETKNMSSAEDIILSGKLLPYRSPTTPLSKFSNKTSTKCVDDVDYQRFEFPSKKLIRHRKSESLSDLQDQRSQSSKVGFIRKSHSLDYKQLSRDSSSKMTRTRSFAPSNDRLLSGKPRWRLLMFGFMRTPTEMELKDIKNRQNRRIPATMFSKHDGEETVSVRREEGKGSWRLLRVLSCKGEVNGVIPSLSCIPHV
ncbi:hypothetical protein AQUCO_06800083v1 [Aquilegia coerulea]|uniref:Uncharacterized protein n=1 Tax=Aquilegia coerulea TaxID=218851 RepID=A0A2G5CBK9_AQUCA|nr:hypothetical protein AQUCO_06800083v1 [Aquilegia coerulea]